jgi:excisionase family DNA binding protein
MAMPKHRVSRDPETMVQDLEKTVPNHHFFTLNEASKILNLSYYTAYRKVITGELTGCLVGGVWRIPRAGIILYFTKQYDRMGM